MAENTDPPKSLKDLDFKDPSPLEELILGSGQGFIVGASASAILFAAVWLFARFVVFALILNDPFADLKVFGWGLHGPIAFLVAGYATTSFFLTGLGKLDLAHRGVKTFLGARQNIEMFAEGYYWAFPGLVGAESVPIGKLVLEVDLSPDDIVDVDDIPIDADVSVTYMAGAETQKDPVKLIRFIDYGKGAAEENMQNETRDEMRQICANESYDELRKKAKEITGDIKKGLQGQMDDSGTGVHIVAVQLKRFRQPTEIQQAASKRKIEKIQKDSDQLDSETKAAQIETHKSTGLTPAEAAAQVQASRGEGQVITHNIVGASSLVNALGTVIAGALNNRTSHSSPAAKRRRRKRPAAQSSQ